MEYVSGFLEKIEVCEIEGGGRPQQAEWGPAKI
jgi:hypothetical protein